MGRNALNNVIRNDSLTVTATITDTNGTPVNLNGYVAYLTVKTALNETSNIDDDPGLMQIEINPVSDPEGIGIVSFQCAPINTDIIPGNYVYDVQVIAPNLLLY